MKFEFCEEERKVSFPTKKLATTKLNKIIKNCKRLLNRKLPVRTYHCPHCNGHHLTSRKIDERKSSIEEVELNYDNRWKNLLS